MEHAGRKGVYIRTAIPMDHVYLYEGDLTCNSHEICRIQHCISQPPMTDTDKRHPHRHSLYFCMARPLAVAPGFQYAPI